MAAEEEGRKMAAVELEWIPETLYNTAISAVVDNYIRSRRDIRSLPENIQFDVYYKVRPAGLLPAPLPQPAGPHPLPRLRAPRSPRTPRSRMASRDVWCGPGVARIETPYFHSLCLSSFGALIGISPKGVPGLVFPPLRRPPG